MARLREHMAMSVQRTGKTYRELHVWVDEPRRWLRADHRTERHAYSAAMKSYVERRWGKTAVVEWLLHIAMDNIDTALKFMRRGTAAPHDRLTITIDARGRVECRFDG